MSRVPSIALQENATTAYLKHVQNTLQMTPTMMVGGWQLWIPFEGGKSYCVFSTGNSRENFRGFDIENGGHV